MKTLITIVVGLVVLPLGVASAEGESSWRIGLKGGLLLGGEMTVDASESFDLDTELGYAVALSADAMVAPKLSIGGFIFGASSETEGGDSFTLLTMGVTIKGRFPLKNGIELRPGLQLGYQRIEPDGLSEITGLDVGGALEVAVPTQGSLEWLAEILQSLLAKLGELVQKQNAPVCQADFTWAWRRSTTDETGYRGVAVRATEGPVP